MIFQWAAILAAMGRGLTAGALRVGSSIASTQGLGAGRYAALRGLSSGRRFVAGALARSSLRGGKGGAFSRMALAGMAYRKSRKRGGGVPRGMVGFLAKDFAALSGSLVELPARLKAFGDGIGQSLGGLGQFSGAIAISQGQLLAQRIRNTQAYATGIAGGEAGKNRMQANYEKALLPYEIMGANLKNAWDMTWLAIKTTALNSYREMGDTINENLGLVPSADAVEKAREQVRKTQDFIERQRAGMSPEECAKFDENARRAERLPDEWWKARVPDYDHDRQYFNHVIQELARGIGVFDKGQKHPPLKSLHADPHGRTWEKHRLHR